MFLIDDVPSFSFGFLVGFGTGFVSRELTSAGQAIVRPVVKAIVRSGFIAVERGRESMARFAESFEDMVAEARSEAHVEVAEMDAAAAEAQAAEAAASGQQKVAARKAKARRRGAH